MPGLGIGLAAVTCESVGGSYAGGVTFDDNFWDLAVAAIGYTESWAICPLEIGATETANGTPLDDLPDNKQWDLIDISDGSGSVHYAPEATSTIESGDPLYWFYWIVGRADGGDAADTDYLRPTGLSDPR